MTDSPPAAACPAHSAGTVPVPSIAPSIAPSITSGKTTPVPTLALAANAVLIGGLLLTATERPAPAQAVPARQTGQYTLVGGDLQIDTSNAIYIVDSVNRELISLSWDRSRKGMEPIGFRDLDSDRTATPGR